MNRFRRCLAAFFIFVVGTSFAGESAVVVVYQPIITQDEDTPMGVKILPVPFLWWYTSGESSFPYSAIAMRNEILTDAPREVPVEDHNLLSCAGLRVGGVTENGSVYVRLENYVRPLLVPEEVQLDDVAEAALECIRRVANDHKDQKRPKLIISGKKGDEAKWAKWQEYFAACDLEKPFTRPKE